VVPKNSRSEGGVEKAKAGIEGAMPDPQGKGPASRGWARAWVEASTNINESLEGEGRWYKGTSLYNFPKTTRQEKRPAINRILSSFNSRPKKPAEQKIASA